MAGVNQPASNNAKQTPVFKDVKYYLIGPVEDKVRVGLSLSYSKSRDLLVYTLSCGVIMTKPSTKHVSG